MYPDQVLGLMAVYAVGLLGSSVDAGRQPRDSEEIIGSSEASPADGLLEEGMNCIKTRITPPCPEGPCPTFRSIVVCGHCRPICPVSKPTVPLPDKQNKTKQNKWIACLFHQLSLRNRPFLQLCG